MKDVSECDMVMEAVKFQYTSMVVPLLGGDQDNFYMAMLADCIHIGRSDAERSVSPGLSPLAFRREQHQRFLFLQ